MYYCRHCPQHTLQIHKDPRENSQATVLRYILVYPKSIHLNALKTDFCCSETDTTLEFIPVLAQLHGQHPLAKVNPCHSSESSNHLTSQKILLECNEL